MRILLQIALIVVFIAMCGVDLNASPAYPGLIEYRQPDGTTLHLYLKGDERMKWAITTDGYSILRNSQGVYEYASYSSNGDLIPSGIKANNIEGRSSAERVYLLGVKKGLRYSPLQVKSMKSASQAKAAASTPTFPTTGQRKLLCILIGFPDKAFTKSKEDFQNLFNQEGYNTDNATGSVRDYYLENSYNQLDLTVTVVGPYTVANSMAYYGANDSNGDDKKPRELVTEAVKLADPDVNYADFDNDANGKVDGIYVIYAGYGEEAGGPENAIWAHAWAISTLIRDGKSISSYSCSPELRGYQNSKITRIGVICHEFGHVLGAPDYYDTDYEDNGEYEGCGKWDLMANGSWNNNGATPAHHNGFTKVYYYNWATATTIENAGSITLDNAKDSPSSFYRINTTTPGEFFFIENRQQLGFDSAIPGHGMIIYHVHKYLFTADKINYTHPQMMYPVCASTTTDPASSASSYGDINSGGCPFPGTSNKASFTDQTLPSAKSWAGANTNKPITGITENTSAKTVKFNVDVVQGIKGTNEPGSNEISAYPNPFNEVINLSGLVGVNRVMVSNIIGQQFINSVINADLSAPGIDTRNLPAGIYLLKIKTNTGTVKTIKLIKEKK